MTRFEPSGGLRGALRPPPDKSISHRAAIVTAMAGGEAGIRGFLDAADTRSTLNAIRAIGAEVEELGDAGAPGGIDLRVRGVGLRGPGSAASTGNGPVSLDAGNAGTLIRILPGWLAGQGSGEWVLDGDESLRRRPVDRVTEPLRLMGANVECRDGRLPPLRVRGATLTGIDYRLPVASAQVKSCLLLAGLVARGETSIVEPAPTRDHTERMLRAAGAEIGVEDAETPIAARGKLPARRVTIAPAEPLDPGEIAVPGDFSSAAFPLVAALLVRGSAVRLGNVGVNPTRVGLLGILSRMGAAVEVEEQASTGPEPVATITARSGPLTATRVAAGEVPPAIDELPLVALLGCFADGETVVTGAEELRHKESDRIATVVEGLAGLGAEIEARSDGFAVRGTGGIQGGVLEARGDHRLAMLGAVAGLASSEGVEVRGFEAAGISYPDFATDLNSLSRV